MLILGLDVGSSSVKAGLLRDQKVVGKIVRCEYPTQYDGARAEVRADDVLKAITTAIKQLGPRAKKIDLIGMTVMAPSWVAMDAKGRAITPVVTHQDRRSVAIAHELEQRVGKERHLEIAGNRPFPGGISSTTCAWFFQNQKSTMQKADLVGHLNTYLHRQLTGARLTDPSNASFMGFYETVKQGGWSDVLCDAVGLSPKLLPEILPADAIGGRLTKAAATKFNLPAGLPVLVGLMDTSAAMLLAGSKPGQLLNVSGSTDVLGLCTDHPVPHEKLLTRAVGVGQRWMSVSTLAAAGSALNWVQKTLFADLSMSAYFKLIDKLASRSIQTAVRFEPYLAGERTSIDQKQGAFSGLTLSTTREEMLGAVIDSLAKTSAARLELLAVNTVKISRNVLVSGGSAKGLGKVLHRDWTGTWKFHELNEATLRGLASLANGAKIG